MNYVFDASVENINAFDKVVVEILRLKKNNENILEILSRLKKKSNSDKESHPNNQKT